VNKFVIVGLIFVVGVLIALLGAWMTMIWHLPYGFTVFTIGAIIEGIGVLGLICYLFFWMHNGEDEHSINLEESP
jgi:hypothetical protein